MVTFSTSGLRLIVVIPHSLLPRLERGLQRNLVERELYPRASGLDYTILRAPILTNAPAGSAHIRIRKVLLEDMERIRY
ncbi:MAG: hypothetical protein JO271_14375 [Verrucomicrobia bacterium]|nr:hypothetical protein [Verrucomicrobiota bacterium]